MSRRLLLIALAALSWQRAALAEESSCSSPSPECAVVGQWELTASFGYGHRTNPVGGKADQPLVVIPHISYYGKRFFLENLDAGFSLYEGRVNTFSLIASPGYDRAFFVKSDLQNIFIPGGTGLPSGVATPPTGETFTVSERRTTYLLGPEWTFGVGPVSGQLNALREITGRHDGTEVRGGLSMPLFRAKGSLIASAGFTWKSAEIVRYYYGVERLYEPGPAFNPFVKLRYSLPLSNRWTLNAFAQREHLAGAIANSPLIAEDRVTTFFAGVVFRVH